MDTNQLVQFLEENVMRLNVELSRYQAKYPPLLPSDGPSSALSFSVGDPIPPWLIDSQHLSPLLASYDMRINELEEDVRSTKEREGQLRDKVKDLIAENDRLRRTTQGQGLYDRRPQHTPAPTKARTTEYDSDTKERIDLLQEENDVLLQQQQITQQELDSLRKELLALSSSQREREDVVTKASVVQTKFSVLEKEKEVLEDQLAKKRTEVATLSTTAANSKKALEDVTIQKDILKKENSELLAREKHLIGFNTALDQDVKSLQEYQRLSEHERESLTKEREDLFNQLVSLERKLAEAEQRENVAIQGLQRAITDAEEAKLQKEQSNIREQQLAKDLNRVTDRLAALPTDLREHHTKETSEIRSQYKAQLDRAQEEIRVLMAEQGDLKALMDRAIRDKRAVEAEITRLQHEPHHEMERYQGEISRAQALSLALQNERDALASQLEGLAASELTSRRALERERSVAVLQAEEAVRKVKRLETDLVLSKEERHKLKQQHESLHKANQELFIEKNAQVNTLSQDLNRIKRECETQVRALENKLDESTSSHSQAEQQLQDQLDEQHRMRERWREETQTTTLRFEGIVHSLKGEASMLRQRCDDLAVRLKEATKDNQSLASDNQSLASDNQSLARAHHDAVHAQALAEHHRSEALAREQQARSDSLTLAARLDRLARCSTPRASSGNDEGAYDGSLRVQLDSAYKEIETLQEQATQLKAEKRKLVRKLQLIKKGLLGKLKIQQEET